MARLIFLLFFTSYTFAANSILNYIKNINNMVLVKESMIPGKDIILPKNTPLFLQETVSIYNWINEGKGTKINIYVPKDKVELFKKHGPYPDGLTAIAVFEDQGIVFVTEHLVGEPIYGTYDLEGNDISNSHPSLNTNTCYNCHENYEDICINGTCSVPIIDIFKK